MTSHRPELRDHIVYGDYWTHGSHLEVSNTFVEMIDWLLGQNPLPRIADLGCGIGRHSLYAKRKGCEILAMDYHPKAIERLHDHAESQGIDIRQADLRAELENCEPASFDGLVCFDTLHHLAVSAAELAETLKKIRRAARPRGCILVTLLTDIDYGKGDPPKRRFLTSARDGAVLLDLAFSACDLINARQSQRRVFR